MAGYSGQCRVGLDSFSQALQGHFERDGRVVHQDPSYAVVRQNAYKF